MNRVFKTIWNRVEQRWVVASETAKSSRSGHRQASKTSQSSGTSARFTPQALALCVVGLMGLQSASAAVCETDTGLNGSSATGVDALACGVNNQANAERSSAVGYSNAVLGRSSHAIGSLNTVTGPASTAFGHLNNAVGNSSSAIGTRAGTILRGTTAIGGATNQKALLILDSGILTTVNGITVNATGSALSTISHVNGVAVSNAQRQAFINSVDNGGALAFGQHSTAIGAASAALGTGSTALGLNSIALTDSSIALGQGSVANRENSLSIGFEGNERQITNVAIGTQQTDAVNVSQLNAAISDNKTEFFSVNSTELGNQNNDGATGIDAVAIGVNTRASGEYSIALGNGSVASGDLSTAIGHDNISTNLNSVAIGHHNTANGHTSSAVGLWNMASEQFSSAFGLGNTANDDSSAIGNNNTAGRYSTALGNSNSADSESTAVGRDNIASGFSVSLGDQNTSRGYQSSSVGRSNTSTGEFSSAIGNNNTSAGIASVAAGADNAATRDYTSAVGRGNVASGEFSSALGNHNVASGSTSSAVGFRSTATGQSTSASGVQSSAVFNGATAVGGATQQSATLTIESFRLRAVNGIPVTATGTSLNSITHVAGVTINAAQRQAFINSTNNGGALAFGQNSTAVGAASIAFGEGSTALGLNSQAVNRNSVALGQGSIANRDNAVSVGAIGHERQITNVAAGRAMTDAVNIRQLQDVFQTFGGGASMFDGSFYAPTYVIQGSRHATVGSAFEAVDHKLNDLQQQVDSLVLPTDGTDFTAYTSEPAAKMLTEAKVSTLDQPSHANELPSDILSNPEPPPTSQRDDVLVSTINTDSTANPTDLVASNRTSSHAADIAQPKSSTDVQAAVILNSAKQYTDGQVAGLQQRLNRFDESMSAGIASALSIGNLPQPTEAGKNMLSLGTASYNGQQALAIGISAVTSDNKYVIKGAFSTNTDSDASGAVSVGFQW